MELVAFVKTAHCTTMRAFVLLSALLLGTSAVLFGQATEGTILGTLTDTSGAVMPNVKVDVTSVETGNVRSALTDQAGEYLVTNLPLGSYTVTAVATGFKKVVHPAVTLTVKARVRVDLALELGEAAQTVEVVAATPLMRTDTAEVGGVVTRDVLQNIPILSRNFMAAAALVPGTTPGGPSSRQRDFSGSALTVGGALAESNNFIIDGISNNMEFSGAMGVTPAMDAIQEFAIQTSQYSAEFGRSGGGVINVAIRSGSNQFHGFAYDYLRNDKLDARPFDFTGTNPPKQALRRNQFGAGLGMPIIRNRLFLFGNYEGTRYPSAFNSFQIVPTAAEKLGDFSASGFVVADPARVEAPSAGATLGTRVPFEGNRIPASRMDPIGLELLKYFPDPNYKDPNPNVRNNYFVRETARDNLDTYNIKSDANLSARNTLTGRLSQQRGGRQRSGWMPNNVLGGKASLDATNTGLAYTAVVNPHIVNEARIGYNYLRFGNEMLFNTQVLEPFNIAGYNVLSFARGYPGLSVRNYTGPTPVRPISSVPNPFFLVEHSWQLMDTISMRLGSHSLKVGGEHSRVAANRFQGRNGGGNLSYDGTYTTPVVGAALEPLRNGVPDMLLGLARSFSTQYAFDAVRIRSNRASLFVQDDWRATRRLTLNLGLRWDYFGPYREEQDRVANFDLATGTRLVPESARPIVEQTLGVPGGELPAGWAYAPADKIYPRQNWKNFAPRAGFAYSATDWLVFRGGMGIFYGVTTANTFNNMGTEGNPFFFDFALQSELDKPIVVRDGFPSGNILAPLSARTFGAYYGPVDRHDPYTTKWNFNVQLSPFRKTVIEIGYSGQNARAFPTLVPGNTPQPGPGAIQDRRPYPNAGFFWQFLPISDSNYNGLEISFRQQQVFGLSIQSAFTFSKALGFGNGSESTLNDPYNFRYDWGPSAYDFRKRWVTALVYRVPNPFSSGLGRAVLGGWETSSLITLQGGFPFSVGVSGPTLNTGAGASRANAIRDPNLSGDARNRERWFDTTAFTTPQNFEWGAQGKNILRAPGLAQVDLALQKQIPVGESKRFVIRGEAQNAFNRVQLGFPSSTLNSPNFGVIRSLQAGPRNIQLVARFEF